MDRFQPEEWPVHSLDRPSPPRARPVSASRSAPAGRPEALLDTVWRILTRRYLLILQAVVLVAAAAYAYSATRDKEYTASASILFRSVSDNLLGTNVGYVDTSREAATNETLLTLGVVADRTSRALNGQLDAEAISQGVEVVTSPESNVMDIQATLPAPALAARVANEYGRSFIEFRREYAVERLEGAIALAREAQAALTATERAGDEGQALRDRINQLETAASLQTGDAELVQLAGAPTAPSAPKPLRNGIIGAMLGLILGFSLAALREHRDRSVHDLEELEQLYGAPVLARIPRAPRLRRDAALAPRSEEAEAFRMLRAGLRFASVDTDLRSIVISSARPGEGKTTIAIRLAETMAQMGDRVVLVEADMYRAPTPAEGLMGDQRGLSDVLVGSEDLLDALEELTVDGGTGEDRSLAVLRRGMLPPNPSELLESPRMGEIMAELEERFDLVIVDGPPLAILSDALTLVGQVSGVVGVSALGQSRRDAIHEFSRLVRMSGGALLGVVANFAPSISREAGHYYIER